MKNRTGFFAALAAIAIGIGIAISGKDTPEQGPEPQPDQGGGGAPQPNPQTPAPGINYLAIISKTSPTNYIKEMQKLIGVASDGKWGPKTTEALAARGFTQNFTLQALKNKLSAAVTVGPLKQGAHVYAKNDMLINRAKTQGGGGGIKHVKSNETTTFRQGEWIGEVISIWPTGGVIIIKRNPAGYLYYTTQDKVRVWGAVNGLLGI